MRRRILAAILSVTGIAILLFGAPLAFVVERLDDESALLRLEREAILAARVVPTGHGVRAETARLPPSKGRTELALYDASGVKVAGVGPARADEVVTRALRDEVVDIETDGRRVVAVPVGADDTTVGAVRAEQPTHGSNVRTVAVLALFTGLGVGVLAVGAAIGFGVAERLAHPVRRLRDAAVRLGDGDFTAEMPTSSVTELQDLANALATTARRLDDLVARERSFSADASHQLRTPLAGLRTSIETELAFPRDDPTEVLHEALDDIDRLSTTITELLVLARSRGDEVAPLSVGPVLAEARSRWSGRFDAAGRTLTVTATADVPAVIGNAAPLRHALDVLLDNALLHGDGATRLAVVVGDGTVTFAVQDEGPGFTDGGAGDRPGGTGGGEGATGLGLPLARRLVESMQGRLTVTHRGPGARVEIVLRRAPDDDPGP